MKSKIIKGLTITLFLTLILSFVAYRSGYFGGLKFTYSFSPNGSALNNQTDTLPENNAPKRLEMMSSSKVLILSDPPLQRNDSNQVKIDSVIKIDASVQHSKSGILLKSEDVKKIKQDSTEIDSLKKQ